MTETGGLHTESGRLRALRLLVPDGEPGTVASERLLDGRRAEAEVARGVDVATVAILHVSLENVLHGRLDGG